MYMCVCVCVCVSVCVDQFVLLYIYIYTQKDLVFCERVKREKVCVCERGTKRE